MQVTVKRSEQMGRDEVQEQMVSSQPVWAEEEMIFYGRKNLRER